VLLTCTSAARIECSYLLLAAALFLCACPLSAAGKTVNLGRVSIGIHDASQGIPRKNGFDRVGNECVRENAPSDVKTRTVLLLCDVETSTLALGRAATLYAKAYACALIADYYFETLLMWHGNFRFCLYTRFQLSKYVYCGPKKHGATLTSAYSSHILICRQYYKIDQQI
jgi:hypothetical protein